MIKNQPKWTMAYMDIHYPIAGAIILVGAIAFLKTLDFLSAQTAKRLLEMAGDQCPDQMDDAD